MKGRDFEPQSASVQGTAKQADETRDRWSWVERSIWTDRMLTALEQGVKGGKWFTLMDKVYAVRNLEAAFQRVKENRGSAGVDRMSLQEFERCLTDNLERLHESLRDGIYRPQAIKRVWIPKPGSEEKRPLGVPTVRDRVVQTALRNVLEPIFERDFARHSYGFRPGRGCKDALRRVEGLLKQGYRYVVDADIKGYFDSIPRDKLMELVQRKVADGRILDLLNGYLQQEVMESMKSWVPAAGTPQGAVISPLLANIYLDPLDRRMEETGIEMVRYADDFLILCRSQAAAEDALGQVRKWTEEAGLSLHPDKTHIVSTVQGGGFDFLGYHFEYGTRWPRKKSLRKMRDVIRRKTRRSNGKSLEAIIEDVNRTLRGWFEYFQHSHRTTFPVLDGWIRVRLRSILRKRAGRCGPGRGFDHQRWPNAFFAKCGLYSLTVAYHTACRPSRR